MQTQITTTLCAVFWNGFRCIKLQQRSSFEKQDPAVATLLKRLSQSGFRLDVGVRGRAAEVEGLQWEILHPGKESEFESDNASSLCLLLEYAGRRVLLPGDLDGSGMFGMLELPDRPCHVLMAHIMEV